MPLSGVNGNWFFATPRLGFAWDTKGNGETVVRGGVGMYRYHEPQLIWSGLLSLPAGQGPTTPPSGQYLSQLDALAGAGGLVFGGSTIDINDNKQPLAYNWSLTLNQKLPWSMNVELGYVGNSQKNLLNNDIANLNAIPLGALPNDSISVNENAYRPLQAYGDLQVYRHSAYANYHGLQTLLSRQRGNFNFTAAYTFSKLLGIRSGVGGGREGPPSICSPSVITATASSARTARTSGPCRSAGCSRSSRTTRPSTPSWVGGSSPVSGATSALRRCRRV